MTSILQNPQMSHKFTRDGLISNTIPSKAYFQSQCKTNKHEISLFCMKYCSSKIQCSCFAVYTRSHDSWENDLSKKWNWKAPIVKRYFLFQYKPLAKELDRTPLLRLAKLLFFFLFCFFGGGGNGWGRSFYGTVVTLLSLLVDVLFTNFGLKLLYS